MPMRRVGVLLLRRLGALLLLLAPTRGAEAQRAAALPPATAGAIDSLFLSMSHSGEPGCAAGVYQNGAVVFARGYGFANLTHDVPITAATRFTGRVGLEAVHRREHRPAGARRSASRSTTTCASTSREMPALCHAGARAPPRAPHQRAARLLGTGRPVGAALRRRLYLRRHAGDGRAAARTQLRARRGVSVQQHRLPRDGGDRAARHRADRCALRRFGDLRAARHARDVLPRRPQRDRPGRATAYSPRGGGWRVDVWNNDIVGQGGIVTTLGDLQRWDENFYQGTVGGREFLDAHAHAPSR